MPEFSPSEPKTARAPITVQPAGLSCSAELYLVSNGAKVATSGIKPFTSTGAKQDISLPITMPSAEGTYPVYLDILTNNLLIGAYKTVEDVVIAVPAPPPPFTFSNVRVQRVRCSGTSWNTLNFWCTITNPTSKSITHTLTPMYRVETRRGYSDPIARPAYDRELTLGPGKSYNYYLAGNQLGKCTIILGFSAGVPYGGCAFLRDENGDDSRQACV